MLGYLSDILNLRKSAQSIEKSEQFDGYTKVVITVSEDIEYSSGDETGRTLTMTCPFGSQKLADDLLLKVLGFQYQPYTSSGAHMDPASELCDGVTVGKVYSGVFKKTTYHGPLYTSDISAPGGDKVNYEYPYKSQQERIVSRNFKSVRASLKIQAEKIAAEVEERKSDMDAVRGELSVQANHISAKVSKIGGDASSFGWELDDSSWTISANSIDILKATKDGLDIYGKITAISGKIGGFDILPNYLSYNGQEWDGTNTVGIYIGSSGIQMGKNFKVDSAGNLTAASGTFEGNVYARSIQYGGSAGYFNGSGLSSGSVYGGSGGKIAGSTLSTYNMTGGVNTSLGYADFANGVFGGWNTASWIKCSTLLVGGKRYSPLTIRYTNASGNISSAVVLATQD